MCGIAGILAQAAVNPAAVDAMTATLAHRGPDGRGRWSEADGRLCLGHRRLAVIDPGAGSAQPLSSADGTLVLCYNGEIYNYLELRARLAAEGAVFRSDGDGEVIVEAYRAWGEDCVRQFNGMFAFALWDRRQRRLFCARDRFGEKPFLFAEGPGFFAFASEYKALFTLAGIDTAVDEKRLARFLCVPADGLDNGVGTVFPAIRQLPAAHVLTVAADDLSWQMSPYWPGTPDPEASRLGMAEAAERFRLLLDDSIRLRLRSDVPVGSCLSGGLDSGAIACLVRRQLPPGADYHVFSGRFPGDAEDEGPFMDSLADEARAIRHQIAPDPQELLAELTSFCWHNELPVNSASQYAQWCVFRLARQSGVVVLLDGQGADEILGGYEQYFRPYLAQTGGLDADAIHARYPGALDHGTGWTARLPGWARCRLARASGHGSDLAFGIHRHLEPPSATRPDPVTLHQALRRDATQGFLSTLLRYGDRNSMAHSVEVRLPFCDHRLFEFAQGLSAQHLMGDAQTKRLLREAMRGVLPESVRTRWRKQGFLPPAVGWLQRGLLDAVEQVVAEPAFAASPLWHPAWWRQAVRRFRAGDHALASGLWKVLATEAWRHGFLAAAATAPRHPALR